MSMRFHSKEELERWIAQAKTAPATPRPVQRKNKPATPPVDLNVQRRILGVDTALRCTGWGIIDARGNQVKAVDCGVIRNRPSDSVSLCLKRLAEGMEQLVQLYHPDIAILEGAFYCMNARTSMMLGAARGAVISTLARHEIQQFEYAPRKVKQAVCGFGNASKEQVARLVSQLLQIKTENFALDSTDALAMALCHAQQLTTSGGLGLPDPL